MEHKKYAAIYCRVSTKYQAKEGASLEIQENECRYEAKRYGYEVFDVFIDEGISGTKLKRDRLQDLIDIIKTQDEDNKIIDAIIVYDLSRLSRSIKHTIDLFKLFDKSQIKLISIKDGLISIKDGLTGENDAISRKIITTVLSLLNELYIDQLKIKVPAGMMKSAECGNHQGGVVPLGYEKLPLKDENGNYVYEEDGERKRIKTQLYINEEERKIVEIAYNKALDGWGAYKIAKFLNDNGYTGKKGGKFRTKVVLDIILYPME